MSTYAVAIIVWLYVLGAGLLWMFIDELVPDVSRTWKIAALVFSWPVGLPSLIAFYVAAHDADRSAISQPERKIEGE